MFYYIFLITGLILSNPSVHTLQNIKDYWLGSIWEQELEEKLYNTLNSKDEINDLSKRLQNKYLKQMKDFDKERKKWNLLNNRINFYFSLFVFLPVVFLKFKIN